jgi:hypothetical protein
MDFTLRSISFFISPVSLTLWVVTELQQQGQDLRGMSQSQIARVDMNLPAEIDVAETLAALQNARRIALNLGRSPVTLQGWQSALGAEQTLWATERRVLPARWELALRLIEQSVVPGSDQALPPDAQPLNDWIKAGGLALIR